MHLRKLQPKLRNWQNATKNQVGFQNWCAYLIGQEHHQVRNILKTLAVTSREIQTAVRLLLTGDLANHAISEGSKAVMQFTISNSNLTAASKSEDSSEESSDEEGESSDGSFTVENLS